MAVQNARRQLDFSLLASPSEMEKRKTGLHLAEEWVEELMGV
jgi:hypothetical protein